MSAFNPNRFKTPTFGGPSSGQKAPMTIEELSKVRGRAGGQASGPGVGSAMTINQIGGMPGTTTTQQQARLSDVPGAGAGTPMPPLVPPRGQPQMPEPNMEDTAAALSEDEDGLTEEERRKRALLERLMNTPPNEEIAAAATQPYRDSQAMWEGQAGTEAQANQRPTIDVGPPAPPPTDSTTPEPSYDTPESVISEMMRQQKDAQAGVREALRRSQSAARQRGLESQRRAGYSITGGSAGSLGRQYGMDLEDLKIRTENEMRKERTGLWDKLLQERQMQRDLEEGGGSGGGAGGAVPLTPMGRWFNEKRFDTGMNEEELLGEFRGDHKDEAGVARDWTPKERDEIMGMYDQTLPKSGAVGTARTVESFTRAHDQDRFPVTAGGMGDTARNAQGGYNVSFKTMHEGGNEVEIGITSPGSADTRGEHTAVISKEDYMKLKSGAGKLVKKFISRGKFKWVVEDK